MLNVTKTSHKRSDCICYFFSLLHFQFVNQFILFVLSNVKPRPINSKKVFEKMKSLHCVVGIGLVTFNLKNKNKNKNKNKTKLKTKT
jgi:hypothetical protein